MKEQYTNGNVVAEKVQELIHKEIRRAFRSGEFDSDRQAALVICQFAMAPALATSAAAAGREEPSDEVITDMVRQVIKIIYELPPVKGIDQ